MLPATYAFEGYSFFITEKVIDMANMKSKKKKEKDKKVQRDQAG